MMIQSVQCTIQKLSQVFGRSVKRKLHACMMHLYGIVNLNGGYFFFLLGLFHIIMLCW